MRGISGIVRNSMRNHKRRKIADTRSSFPLFYAGTWKRSQSSNLPDGRREALAHGLSFRFSLISPTFTPLVTRGWHKRRDGVSVAVLSAPVGLQMFKKGVFHVRQVAGSRLGDSQSVCGTSLPLSSADTSLNSKYCTAASFLKPI